MDRPARTPRPRRLPRESGFRPAFTLMLLYFFGFFVLFSLLLVMPELLHALETLPPGATPEEDRAIAREVARRAAAGRLPWALGATVIACALGAYTRTLPGLRLRD
ncbi:MAG: hypothetical protein DCC71_10490 [Proteobacteria bacterium]|nr:MAG: hypothetical protein DCC71_10490 [Pseudomonadota bacterium]